jgi:Na+/proline symporter
VPGLANAEEAYVRLAQVLLPQGVIGLVLAGFFSHTMAMVASDANVISSVITRDREGTGGHPVPSLASTCRIP